MFELKNIVRQNIYDLKAYSSARDEFSGKEGVFLDANENPFGKFNRYPDPYQRELKQKLSALKAIPPENIFIGNGSDEVIDLAYRIFCRPGKDKALTFGPTYGMYQVSAEINDVKLATIPLDVSFQINFAALDKSLEDETIKLIFICSPNNPTGNCIKDIDIILKKFKGIVFVDEAYIDFSKSNSWISKIESYPNLVVSQTFSKAWGLASARVGVAYASAGIISVFNKVKAPYNVSSLNQKAALDALESYPEFETTRDLILKQREILEKNLSALPVVKKIYPSDSNFLLIEVEDADKVYTELVSRNVITRNRTALVKNCIRITVGKAEENEQLITALTAIV